MGNTSEQPIISNLIKEYQCWMLTSFMAIFLKQQMAHMEQLIVQIDGDSKNVDEGFKNARNRWNIKTEVITND